MNTAGYSRINMLHNNNLVNNSSIKNQINKTHEIIKTFRTNKSAKIAASILNDSF